jgi:hypothetical protein
LVVSENGLWPSKGVALKATWDIQDQDALGDAQNRMEGLDGLTWEAFWV